MFVNEVGLASETNTEWNSESSIDSITKERDVPYGRFPI